MVKLNVKVAPGVVEYQTPEGPKSGKNAYKYLSDKLIIAYGSFNRLVFWLAILLIIIFAFSLALFWGGVIFCAMLCAGLLVNLIFFQNPASKIELNYELDSALAEGYAKISGALIDLNTIPGIWAVSALTPDYDSKRPTRRTVWQSRRVIRINFANPRYVKTNLSIPCIPAYGKLLYFFPEGLLVKTGSSVKFIKYEALTLSVVSRLCLEGGSIPQGTTVLEYAWEHATKNGGPDKNFKNNRQLPVVMYDYVTFQGPNSFKAILEISQNGGADGLKGVLSEFASLTKPPLQWPTS